MIRYSFILTHDKGSKTVFVHATSEQAAKKMIMDMEGCPESALTLK